MIVAAFVGFNRPGNNWEHAKDPCIPAPVPCGGNGLGIHIYRVYMDLGWAQAATWNEYGGTFSVSNVMTESLHEHTNTSRQLLRLCFVAFQVYASCDFHCNAQLG